MPLLSTEKSQSTILISYSTKHPKTKKELANLTTKQFKGFGGLKNWLRSIAGPKPRKMGDYLITGPTVNGTEHSKENIGDLGCFGIEFDGSPENPGVRLARVMRWLGSNNIDAIGYETWSQCEEFNRWRIFISCSRCINVNGTMEVDKVYRYLLNEVFEKFNIRIGHESRNHNRIWYTPSWPEGETRRIIDSKGSLSLDIDSIGKMEFEGLDFSHTRSEPVNIDTSTTIGYYNANKDIRDILAEHGYWCTKPGCLQKGGFLEFERWGCPTDTKEPGVIVLEQPQGGYRVYSHHIEKDPLWNERGHTHDAFSVMAKLKFDGDEEKALDYVRTEISFDELEDIDDEEEPEQEKVDHSALSLIERLPPVLRKLSQQLHDCSRYPQTGVKLFGALAIAQILINTRFVLKESGGAIIWGNKYYNFISGAGRGKDSVLKLAKIYAKETETACVTSIASAEAFDNLMVTNGNWVCVWDEFSPNDPELKKLILRFNEAYSAVDGMWRKRVKAADSDDDSSSLENPFFTLITASTPEAQFSTKDPHMVMLNTMGGNMRRTMAIFCKEPRIANRNQKKAWADPIVMDWYKWMESHFDADHPERDIDGGANPIEIPMSKEAREYAASREDEVDDMINSGTLTPIQEAILAGYTLNAKKDAWAIAVSERAKEATLEHMKLAFDIMDAYIADVVGDMHHNVSASTVEADAKKIEEKMKSLLKDKKKTAAMPTFLKGNGYKIALIEHGLITNRFLSLQLSGAVIDFAKAIAYMKDVGIIGVIMGDNEKLKGIGLRKDTKFIQLRKN